MNNFNKNFPSFEVCNTHVRKLKAKHIDQEFQLYVYLPEDYDKKMNLPVLYVIDPDDFFGIITGVVSYLTTFKEIPPMLVVGVGYGAPMIDDQHNFRRRDYLPGDEHKKKQQGADYFSDFIEHEVMPIINKDYKTNPTDSIYFGMSYGGVFGLYNLFNKTKLFQRYIILCPSAYWNNGICFEYEKNYADTHNELPVQLYLGVGDADGATNLKVYKRLINVLRSRRYKGLTLTAESFSGETHYSIVSASFAKAIKAIMHFQD